MISKKPKYLRPRIFVLVTSEARINPKIKAIKVAKKHSDVVDYYTQMSKENLLTIKYENIESDAINTVKEIALFIQINLTEQNAELVSNKFSKEKVRSIIKKCESDMDKRMQETGKVNENEVVRVTSTNIRAFDMDTGFQSGHVSGHLSSEWRNIFSKYINSSANFCF